VLTRTQFLAAFPEFTETDTSLVDAKLAEAARRIDPAVWLTWENDGHGQLTAHLIANSPTGNSAKLQAKGDAPRTVYEGEFRRLQRMVAAGIRST
jgi:hypothetical protein